ncbi:sensor histidine kinase [Pedobacter gandavensis]|uniref:sensor histidine kinase n=1 Tax=Pedobacter gandavensis TaxID=2679963 RepID=UPI00292EF42F|nr:histidine kinase [Pedobacter gandavensis]
MKNKVLYHEILFFVLLAAMSIIKVFLSAGITTGMSAAVWTNLLPRTGVILLFLMVYLWINLFSIPRFLKVKEQGYPAWLLLVFQFLALGFLMAFGVNVATYYAHPADYSYNGYGLFSMFGYNDQPLKSIWMGWERGLLFLTLYGIYAALREYLCYRIENSGSKSRYYTLIANQVSGLLFIYLMIPGFFAIFNLVENDRYYLVYFLAANTALFIYVSNIFWLFPRYLKDDKLSVEFVVRLLVSTFVYAFPVVVFLTYNNMFGVIWLENWLFQMLVTVPCTWLVYRSQKDELLEWNKSAMELTRSKADLQFLRAQINPHFLFNALNTLYGTALIDGSKRTADGIQKLGDMMRFMLEDNHQDFIPMKDEIAYLRNYIDLQKLRILPSDQIRLEANLDIAQCDHLIVPMLLIPFVENAFKHGIDGDEKSWIIVDLSCTADSIHFKVRNSVSKAVFVDPERKSSGIGLNNVRERLMLFYEGKHQLKCGRVDDEFIAELTIQLL